jgi:hypothetical protein
MTAQRINVPNNVNDLTDEEPAQGLRTLTPTNRWNQEER